MVRIVDDIEGVVPVSTGSVPKSLTEESAYGRGYSVPELLGICAEFGVPVQGIVAHAELVRALRKRRVALPPKKPGLLRAIRELGNYVLMHRSGYGAMFWFRWKRLPGS